MITEEDFNVISAYEAADGERRASIFATDAHSLQMARTWINLMSNVNKVQTVRYVLTMIDDAIYEDNQRVRIFWTYARHTKQSVWTPLLLMLTRDDGFVVNQTSRLICKLACWGDATLKANELAQYFTFLKEQLRQPVSANHEVTE